MSLEFILPKDKKQIERQIRALKIQIQTDTRDKDRAIHEMALQPCAFQTIWDVTAGRLNCMLVQRSGDLGLGIPFNTAQYAVLIHLIAQVTGLEAGQLTHVINNAHIYENHVAGIKEQLTRAEQALPAPKLLINPDIKDFYQFKPDDILLDDYKHLGKISMEVAV